MMPAKNFPIFHIFCSILFAAITSADPWGYSCEFSPTWSTPNNSTTIFRDNLNSLLSTLPSNAKNQNGFFSSTSGDDTSDTAYGLFLCRGDVSADICKKCVTNAIKDIVKWCPFQKEAVVCYDYRLLRYSDKNIFGTWDQYFDSSSSDDRHNVSEPQRFHKVLANLMNELETRVANDDRKDKKFATQEANFTHGQKIYALAQCTPDISSDICKACLSEAISNFPTSCKKSKSCRVVLLNCFVWYEFFLFYDSKASAPPLSPPRSFASTEDDRRGKWPFSARNRIVVIAVPVISIVFITVTVSFSCFRRKVNDKKGRPQDINERSNAKPLHYNFGAIQNATNNFSFGNRIGRGGFGDVYKGKLPNGLIAVKRLSQSSIQGAEEFQSEVLLVAKLQHRNLVKLLGFCLQGVERILIYEFVPNRSLDYYLFDAERQRTLNWAVRLMIILGALHVDYFTFIKIVL